MEEEAVGCDEVSSEG